MGGEPARESLETDLREWPKTGRETGMQESRAAFIYSLRAGQRIKKTCRIVVSPLVGIEGAAQFKSLAGLLASIRVRHGRTSQRNSLAVVAETFWSVAYAAFRVTIDHSVRAKGGRGSRSGEFLWRIF